MSSDFLEKILEHKKILIKEKQAYFAQIKKKLGKEKLRRYSIFKQSISLPGRINLIAEIKKASPSRGLIRKEFDLLKIAKIYSECGASAYSVLTEEKYFLGKPLNIKKVSDHFKLPVLTKDFILDDGQIFEAFANGASAVLLIVAILTDAELKHLLKTAALLDVDCLVEVHDEVELKRALAVKAEIIGINNRNLHTFEVDLTTSHRLIPLIPKGKVIVAESGIKTHQDVLDLKKRGAHAVLIGEAFLRAPDIGQKVKEILSGE